MLQTEWGALIGMYLFLGGMSAGAFVTAAAMYLRDKKHHRTIVCVSMWLAVACLAFGLVLLLFDLVHPLRGIQMWSAFSHWTSWMTYGAWGVFCAIVFFGLSAVMATRPVSDWLASKISWYAEHREILRKVCAVGGIVFGTFVAVYSGTLLMMSKGVPLWDSLLLPCLFTVSAFDTGVALVEIVAVAVGRREPLEHWAHVALERAVVALVILELAVLAVFFFTLAGGDSQSATQAAATSSVHMLTSGILAPYFWGMFVLLGLGFPLVAAVVGLTRKSSPMVAVTLIGAVGALIGGCELRFLILAAGVHADVVGTTVMHLIS